jgi:prepilin-type N-terminal cleavage/methylation domain-containing protein
MNRRGFTIVELLAVVAVLGLLASIALPKYQQFRKRAESADILGAMTAVRVGAFQYNEAVGTWPPTARRGTVPRGLSPYLTAGGALLFRGRSHQLQWRTMRVGGRRTPLVQVITASLTDGVTCQSLYGLWGGARNGELVGACNRRRGTVTLYIDR